MIANIQLNNNLAALRPGTVLSTGRPGFRHFGVSTDCFINGLPTVISNTGKYGKVIEESLEQFKEQGDLKIEGYWGSLTPQNVLRRARENLGTRYLLINWNCEHFVRFAHGLKPESPQVAFVGVIVIGAILLIGLARA